MAVPVRDETTPVRSSVVLWIHRNAGREGYPVISRAAARRFSTNQSAGSLFSFFMLRIEGRGRNRVSFEEKSI